MVVKVYLEEETIYIDEVEFVNIGMSTIDILTRDKETTTVQSIGSRIHVFTDNGTEIKEKQE